MDFEQAKKHVYALESIRGEMYVKYIDYATKNPKADLTTLQAKLKAMQEAADFIMELMERVNKAEYEVKKLEIINNKLMISNL